MAGTKAGAIKTRDKNLANNPNFYADIGRIGGKNGTTGGFAAATQEQVREWGSIGGRKSRRGPAKKGNA